MPRSRNIKPAFFKNEVLAGLPFEYRLLFIGTWTIADKAGRFEDRPLRIKMEVFPADNVDVDAGLQSLHDNGFILRYSVDGQRYCQVLAWHHQSPHKKEAESTIPAPCEHSASTGNSGTSRADSLIPDSLIPDSLIPDLGGLALELLTSVQRVPYELVETAPLLRAITGSLQALIKGGKSPPEAADFLLAVTLDGIERRQPINRFWFEDAKWRNTNASDIKPPISATAARVKRQLDNSVVAIRSYRDPGTRGYG